MRTTDDTPIPAGLYSPFDRAWLAVKVFIDRGPAAYLHRMGRIADLPDGTFPEP